MANPVKPPVSFDKPTPASRAKAKAQAMLDRSRNDALAVAESPAMVAVLARAQKEFARKLKARVAAGHSTDAIMAEQVTLMTLNDVLGRALPQFVWLLDKNAKALSKLGMKSTTDLLAAFEGRAPGALRPLAVPEMVAASADVLSRHRSSVDRYGAHVIGLFRQRVQIGVLTGKSFDEVASELAKDGGGLLETRGWAERIARTEGMNAYNRGALEEMKAQRNADFGDLKKKLIETFDARTAEDSYPAHGQVRELEGYFVDGEGRQYLNPPGRPNDRGVCIPWRDAWKHPALDEVETPPPELTGETVPVRALPEVTTVPPGVLVPTPAAVPTAPPLSVAAAPEKRTPPAPPTDDVATERPAWQAEPIKRYDDYPRVLRNAMRGDEGGEPMREAVQGLLSKAGLVSYDRVDGRDGARAFAFATKDDHVDTAVHDWNGEIVVNRGLWGAAKNAAKAMKDSKDLGATIRGLPSGERHAFTTLIHEELHGHSPIQKSAYAKLGVGLEEAVTESMARVMVRRIGKIERDDRTPGLALPLWDEGKKKFVGVSYLKTYDGYIEDLYNASHSVVGGDTKKFPKKIEDAMFALRGAPPKKIAKTAEEHFEMFAEALGAKGKGAELQAAFGAAQKDRKAIEKAQKAQIKDLEQQIKKTETETKAILAKSGQRNEAPAPAHESVSPHVYDRYVTKMNEALKDPGADVRTTTRELLDAHGLKSYDIHNGGKEYNYRSHVMGFYVAPREEFVGFVACHSTENGSITFSEDSVAWAQKGMAQLAAVPAAQRASVLKAMSPGELNGITLVIHEELHGYSAITENAVKKHGTGIEEAITESTARMMVRKIGGIDRDDRTPGIALPKYDETAKRFKAVYFTDYDHYIEDFYEAAHRVMKAPPGVSEVKIENAMIALRSKLRAPIDDPNDHFKAFGVELGLTEAEGKKIGYAFMALQAERKNATP